MNATIEEHRRRRNSNGLSRWYVTVDGRRRCIELQEYKGRLYLYGCLYSGIRRVLEFEETLRGIERKVGRVRPQ